MVGRWPGTRSTDPRSSGSSARGPVGFCAGAALCLLARGSLGLLGAGLLFHRHHDFRSLPSEALAVEVFDELRQRRLPWLLAVVVELAELLRVHPELACHLHVRMREVEALPCLDPILEVVRARSLRHELHP